MQNRSLAPHHHGRAVVDDEYRRAVVQARTDHPNHGPKRIAHALGHRFPTANVATVWRFLQAAGLSKRAPKKRTPRPIQVGYHRVQLDIQHLPAIKGGHGRECTISIIHLRTRMKYVEIHTSMSSKRVSAVLERAVRRLPPFHLVVTDTAMTFTMAYTAHPERKTTFERTIERLGLGIGGSPNTPCGRTASLSAPIPPTMMNAFPSSSSLPPTSASTSTAAGKCTTTPSDLIKAWLVTRPLPCFSAITPSTRPGCLRQRTGTVQVARRRDTGCTVILRPTTDRGPSPTPGRGATRPDRTAARTRSSALRVVTLGGHPTGHVQQGVTGWSDPWGRLELCAHHNVSLEYAGGV